MGTIDTILSRGSSISFGTHRFVALDQVSLRFWLTVAVAIMAAKLEKRRTRIHLAELDEAQLRDIGITRAEAETEIRKSLIFTDRFFE